MLSYAEAVGNLENRCIDYLLGKKEEKKHIEGKGILANYVLKHDTFTCLREICGTCSKILAYGDEMKNPNFLYAFAHFCGNREEYEKALSYGFKHRLGLQRIFWIPEAQERYLSLYGNDRSLEGLRALYHIYSFEDRKDYKQILREGIDKYQDHVAISNYMDILSSELTECKKEERMDKFKELKEIYLKRERTNLDTLIKDQLDVIIYLQPYLNQDRLRILLELSILDEKVKELQTIVDYTPGGVGYEQTKNEFEDLCKLCVPENSI